MKGKRRTGRIPRLCRLIVDSDALGLSPIFSPLYEVQRCSPVASM